MKSVHALKMRLVAPMPEQIETPTIVLDLMDPLVVQMHSYTVNSFIL